VCLFFYTKQLKMNLKLLIVTSLMSVTLSSCGQNTTKKESKDSEIQSSQKQSISELISPAALNEKLGDIQLIDVRTSNEFNRGHIKNAMSINFYDGHFYEQMSKLDKNKEIYIYCRSGNRSGKAASKLKEQGFTKIYDLQGGIINWTRNSLETVK